VFVWEKGLLKRGRRVKESNSSSKGCEDLKQKLITKKNSHEST